MHATDPPGAGMTTSGRSARSVPLDAARGVALLGILLVNAEMFAQPISRTLTLPIDEGPLSMAVWWFTQTFCTGKFYPLFAMLFGVGVVMLDRAAASRGQRPTPVLLRRFGLLGVFGLLHILLLWSGDILLFYAVLAVVSLPLLRTGPRTLAVTAGVLFAIAALLSAGAAAVWDPQAAAEARAGGAGCVQDLTPDDPPGTDRPVTGDRHEPEVSPIRAYIDIITSPSGAGAFDPRAGAIEERILREGPFRDAIVVRIVNYAGMLVYAAFFVTLPVLGCFCIGAALAKSGAIDALSSRRPAAVRWVVAALSVGGVAGVGYAVSTFLSLRDAGAWAAVTSALCQTLGGPVLAFGYLGGVLVLCGGGAGADRRPTGAGWLVSLLAAAGRCSLSCYILQSVLMSWVMLHWGLGLYGQTTWAERFALSLAVYAVVVVAASVWMRLFPLGPLEWLWRAGTHLTLRPTQLPAAPSPAGDPGS